VAVIRNRRYRGSFQALMRGEGVWKEVGFYLNDDRGDRVVRTAVNPGIGKCGVVCAAVRRSCAAAKYARQ